VRAMTRHPEEPAAKNLADAGADVVVADMEDTASLDRAFTGAYGVYSECRPSDTTHDEIPRS
jgi:uncharacterized protein YbjT (DUF2867 family)